MSRGRSWRYWVWAAAVAFVSVGGVLAVLGCLVLVLADDPGQARARVVIVIGGGLGIVGGLLGIVHVLADRRRP